MINNLKRIGLMLACAIIGICIQAQDVTREWVEQHYTKREVMIPMRDGVKLFTSIYEPIDATKLTPIIMQRTPYQASPYGDGYSYNLWGKLRNYARERYVIVLQDVRGKWMSEGEFVDVRPFIENKQGNNDIDEASDTYDTAEWLINNVKSNGSIGVLGTSYPGFYATMAALSGHPAIKAVSPQAPVTDWWMGDDYHHHGVLMITDMLNFVAQYFGRPRPVPTQRITPMKPFFADDEYSFFLRNKTLKDITNIVGDSIAFWQDLMAHHDSRVPRLGPRPSTQTRELMDMRNNVFYNWGGNGCYGGEGMRVNIVNNYYKPGPGTAKRSTTIQKRIASIGIRTTSYTKHDTSPNQWDVMWHVWGKYYVNGNVNSKHQDVTNDNWTYGIYNQITNSDVDNTFTQKTRDTLRISQPNVFEQVTTHTAADAYERVLAYAGASLHRDWVDELMVNDTRDGTATYTGKLDGYKENGSSTGYPIPGIIDSQDDNRPNDASADWQAWPVLNSEAAPSDTDQDGMPDTWEQANGLNPNNPSDGAADCGNGYTHLEVFMNSLVADITTAQNAGGIVLCGQQEYTPSRISPLPSQQAIPHPTIHSLNGQLLNSQPRKGVYIQNHQKFMKE